MLSPTRLIFITIGFLALYDNAWARFVTVPTPKELEHSSDLIVIGRFVESRDSGERLPEAFGNGEIDGVTTTFAVDLVLKGGTHDQRIRVLHYRWGEHSVRRRNSASTLIDFAAGGRLRGYLLFLRKRDDGRYEPASGQTDAELSIFKLAEPDLQAEVEVSLQPPASQPAPKESKKEAGKRGQDSTKK